MTESSERSAVGAGAMWGNDARVTPDHGRGVSRDVSAPPNEPLVGPDSPESRAKRGLREWDERSPVFTIREILQQRRRAMKPYGRALEWLDTTEPNLAAVVREYVRTVNAEAAFWRTEAVSKGAPE